MTAGLGVGANDHQLPHATMTVTDASDADSAPLGPYHQAGDLYWRHGWQPFPVKGKATSIPQGITGHYGGHIDRPQVIDWVVDRPTDNIALRLNGVIGIDVDAYEKDGTTKHGDTTLTLAEQTWGPLPPTWRSTSRDASNPSGIRFYRVPTGDINLETIVRHVDTETGEMFGDIEIIQFHHRYALAWPSIHPDTGNQYRWYTPDGIRATLGLIPRADELPELPPTWWDALTEGRSTSEPRDYTPADPQHAPHGEWHDKVTDHYQAGVDALTGPAGSRHDNTLRAVAQLARDESRGRSGSTSALTDLRAQFIATVDSDTRDGAGEYDSMVTHARQLVATTISTADNDQALMAEVFGHLPAIERSTTPPPATVEPLSDGDDGPFAHFGAWAPTDLTRYLDPNWAPDPPTLLTRDDGRSLYYRRNVNWLHGASGEGKTWVALVAVAQELQAGRDVVWVHYEDPEADKITHRLILLGVPTDIILDRFHACVVGSASMIDGIPFLRAVIAHYDADLIVIDSIGEAIGSDGVAVKDDEKFVAWIHQTCRILAGDGNTVLGIDHLPMGEPGRLDPVGSFRKKAATTGAMFLAQSPKAPTKDKAGYITLTCAKDRSGTWTKGEVAAIVHLAPNGSGGTRVEVVAPKHKGPGPETESEIMRAAKAAVKAVQIRRGDPYNRGELESVIHQLQMATDKKRAGIDYATAVGWLAEDRGAHNRRLYTIGDLTTFDDDSDQQEDAHADS